MPAADPTTRYLTASVAANARWACEPDRTAATLPARAAFERRFEDQVDPQRTLTPTERAKRVRNARTAYFHRLALRSAATRTERRRGVSSDGSTAA